MRIATDIQRKRGGRGSLDGVYFSNNKENMPSYVNHSNIHTYFGPYFKDGEVYIFKREPR